MITYDFLKTNPLFSGITKDQFSFVRQLFHEKKVEKGDLVISQGKKAQALYIIVTGRVLVFRETKDSESTPIDTSGPGECIGEMGYFTDQRRSASVRALETCALLRLKYRDIDHALQKIPGFSINLTNIISKRLISAHGRFYGIVQEKQYFEKTIESLFKYLDLSDVFSLENGVEDLLQRIVHMSSSLLNAERASLFLIDQVTGELWTKVAQNEKLLKIRIPKNTGVAGWVVNNNQLVNIKSL